MLYLVSILLDNNASACSFSVCRHVVFFNWLRITAIGQSYHRSCDHFRQIKQNLRSCRILLANFSKSIIYLWTKLVKVAFKAITIVFTILLYSTGLGLMEKIFLRSCVSFDVQTKFKGVQVGEILLSRSQGISTMLLPIQIFSRAWWVTVRGTGRCGTVPRTRPGRQSFGPIPNSRNDEAFVSSQNALIRALRRKPV